METICRVCLVKSSQADIIDENVAENIKAFANVQIAQDDGFPQHICETCLLDLGVCLKFRERCEASYAKLQSNEGEDASPLKSEQDFDDSLSEADRKSHVRQYECKKCPDRTFPTKRSLALHEGKKHAPKSFGCDHCRLAFVGKYALNLHLRKKHSLIKERRQKAIFQCHVCGKTFNYHAELSRHLCAHTAIRQFKCNQCHNSYKSKSALTKHLIKHSGIKRFECLLCPKAFTHKSNLQTHLKVHSGEKKFGCNVCGKSFKANRTLQLHLKIHSNERDFPCSECEKAFVNKYDLLRHLKIHEKKRQIEDGVYDGAAESMSKLRNKRQCEICGKICSGAGDLKKHLRVHTDERPFGCSWCKKTFKSTSTLHCHERIHSQSRPYVCKYCNRGFSQSSNLRTHERLHSGLKPYDCVLCEKAFNRKRDLENHLKKHEADSVKVVFNEAEFL